MIMLNDVIGQGEKSLSILNLVGRNMDHYESESNSGPPILDFQRYNVWKSTIPGDKKEIISHPQIQLLRRLN